jgi:hypothetical protein
MRMTRRFAPFVAALLLAVPFAAGAQGTATLGITASSVKVDGLFGDKEYSLVREAAGMKLGITWTADILYLGFSAPTKGWVAVGLGSTKMDGALLYMGYITGHATELKVQRGSAHRHVDADEGPPALYAMKETGVRSVMEIALKAAGAISAGQRTLEIIIAMGAADSFVSLHKARASFTVELSR